MEKSALKDLKDSKEKNPKESEKSEENTPEKKCKIKPEIRCHPVYGDLLAVSAGIAALIADQLDILELETAINLLGLINQNMISILKQRYIDKKSGQIID